MSLLDNASLVLTPNAYKEGKLYSVIPSDGNGDFTATRATTATRVNAEGLVDLVPYNLVSYSEQFENAAWQKTRINVSANATTAPNGSLTADKVVLDTTPSQVHLISRILGNPLSENIYSISFYVKKDEIQYCQFRLTYDPAVSQFRYAVVVDLNDGTITDTFTDVGFPPTPTSTIEEISNGWYRVIINFNNSAGKRVDAAIYASLSSNYLVSPTINGDGTSGFYLWGAQLVEGTSARDYLRTETRLNIPRVDYSLGGCPNILLEPQRTNLLLQSSSFDSGSWAKAALSVTANTNTSPSGIQDADTLTADGANNSHNVGQIIGVTNAVTYSFSVYAKKETNNFFQLLGSTGAFGSNVWANFDLNTGAVGTVGLLTTASIQSVGNDWYRCTITGAAIATTNAFMVFNLITSATAPRGESNTLSTSVFLWGAQFEAGAYATSYIPTTTASVTRNADSLTRNNIFTNGLITAAGGTWFVEIRNNIDRVRDIGGPGLALSDIASGAITALSLRNFTQRLTISKYITGAPTTLYTTITDTIKVAFKWNGTTADVFVNGTKVVSATPFAITALEWIINPSPVDVPKNINQMALWATPLTDTQLTQLTTL